MTLVIKHTVDYPFLRAWNIMMLSSSPEYNLDKAREDNAPQEAIYLDYKKSWATFDQIESEATASEVAGIAICHGYVKVEFEKDDET